MFHLVAYDNNKRWGCSALFAKRLAETRRQKKLTQEELATLLGVTRSAVSLWEIGKREPDFDMLKNIAVKCAVTVDWLLGKVSAPTDSLVPERPWTPPDPKIEYIGTVDSSFSPAPESDFRKHYNAAPDAKTILILGHYTVGVPLAQQPGVIGFCFEKPDLPPGEYFAAYANDDSMEPLIPKASQVLILIENEFTDNELYCINIANRLTFKRLYHVDGKIELVPENHKYPRQVMSPADVQLIGKVMKVISYPK